MRSFLPDFYKNSLTLGEVQYQLVAPLYEININVRGLYAFAIHATPYPTLVAGSNLFAEIFSILRTF